jgi:hypothetical protein
LRSLRQTTFVLMTPCLLAFGSVVSAQTFPNTDHDQVILTAFRQAYKGENDGEAHGDCASVAVIKAAMATFGEDAIFKSGYPSVDWTTTTVILRNGEEIDLLRSEADQAVKRSGFKLVGSQAILDKANFAFAVMAKRAVAFHVSSLTFPDQSTYAMEFGSATNLDKAYSFLNGPQTGSHLPVLLGLASGPAKRKKQLAYVYGNSYHAAFASMAQYDVGGISHSIPAFLWGHVTLNLGADLANDDFSVRDAAPTQVAR